MFFGVFFLGYSLFGQIEATDKSASIRVAFSARAAAEDLSRQLRGVTVKIKGVKLHAFVRVRVYFAPSPTPLCDMILLYTVTASGFFHSTLFLLLMGQERKCMKRMNWGSC